MVLGTSIGLTLTFVGVGEWLGLVHDPPAQDWEAYWDAGMRLRTGAPLYPPVQDQGAGSVYRYPPWFAVAWIPLTFMPQSIVVASWVAAMFAASLVALWPLLSSGRWPSILLGALFAPFLAQAASGGNVQPLLVAGLVHSLDRAGGPVFVGIAGSLKGFPLLYAVRYLALRQGRRAFVAISMAIVLTAPILLFDLTNYPWYAGALAGLWVISPLAWALGALLGIGIIVRYARTQAGWFAASLGVVLAIPRLLYFDMTFLLVTGRGLLHHRARAAPLVARE